MNYWSTCFYLPELGLQAREQHWNWQAFYYFVRSGSKPTCKVGFTAIQSLGILSLLFSSVMFLNTVNVTRNTEERAQSLIFKA